MLVSRVSGMPPEPSAFITHTLKAGFAAPWPPSRGRDDRNAILLPSGDQIRPSSNDPSVRAVSGVAPEPSALATQMLPALLMASLPSRARDDSKAMMLDGGLVAL